MVSTQAAQWMPGTAMVASTRVFAVAGNALYSLWGDVPRHSRRPPKEFSSTALTESAMAIIAQEGWTRPVVASGTPTPLKKNASHRFCTVLR